MKARVTQEQRASAHPSFAEAFRFWVKLGFISFGGPAGQIAIMQTELVDEKRWISQSRFLHALNYCMLLPGPEAQQLAIYIGWLLHKTWGGIVAGAFFVIPSMFVLWGLSYIYTAFGNIPWIAAVFYGLKPAVTAIVLVAVIRGARLHRDLLLQSCIPGDRPDGRRDRRDRRSALARKILRRVRPRCCHRNVCAG